MAIGRITTVISTMRADESWEDYRKRISLRLLWKEHEYNDHVPRIFRREWKKLREHPLDNFINYCESNGINCQILRHDVDCVVVTNTKKKGSWHCSFEITNPWSYLERCELCKKLGSVKSIKYRSITRVRRTKEDEYGPNVLCMSCWNKMKAIAKRECDALEIQKLTTKLKRELNDEKNKDIRRSSQLPL